jgi:hypothetical protein
MITMEDAIERARLAADDDNLLSQEMYNRLCSQLNDAEKYAFTIGLVDLGIQTKLGTKESRKIVAKVLGKGYTEEVTNQDPFSTDKFL